MIFNMIKSALRKQNFYVLIFLYITVATFFEKNPADVIIYYSIEGMVMILMGLFFELITSKTIGTVFFRLFIYIILIGVVGFFLMIPFAFILFFNSDRLPELDLFYSEKVAMVANYLEATDNFLALFTFPFDVLGWGGLYFTLGVAANYLFNRFRNPRGGLGAETVPPELIYTSFMTLGFLIGLLPAFIIGMFIPGAFPFVLLLVMRIFTESQMGESTIF